MLRTRIHKWCDIYKQMKNANPTYKLYLQIQNTNASYGRMSMKSHATHLPLWILHCCIFPFFQGAMVVFLDWPSHNKVWCSWCLELPHLVALVHETKYIYIYICECVCVVTVYHKWFPVPQILLQRALPCIRTQQAFGGGHTVLAVDSVEVPIFYLLPIFLGNGENWVLDRHTYGLAVPFRVVHDVVHLLRKRVLLLCPHVHCAWCPMAFEDIDIKCVKPTHWPTVLCFLVELPEYFVGQFCIGGLSSFQQRRHGWSWTNLGSLSQPRCFHLRVRSFRLTTPSRRLVDPLSGDCRHWPWHMRGLFNCRRFLPLRFLALFNSIIHLHYVV